ncbi:unnamed protein product [Euphydryas editha]|uniref:Uncharacterized protein n=1 Tax=Euphydryas editha TaxID=104508 RepID=A0AAU9VB80_EUPED|nr:unnamed protein product [Euphydryas editha]
MGNKTKNNNKIPRCELRKLRKAISASVPRSKGLFRTTKFTVEQDSEATASTSGFETGVCDKTSLIAIDPDYLQIAATTE